MSGTSLAEQAILNAAPVVADPDRYRVVKVDHNRYLVCIRVPDDVRHRFPANTEQFAEDFLSKLAVGAVQFDLERDRRTRGDVRANRG